MNIFIYKPRELLVSSYLAISVYHHISLSWSQATILRGNKAKKTCVRSGQDSRKIKQLSQSFVFLTFDKNMGIESVIS